MNHDQLPEWTPPQVSTPEPRRSWPRRHKVWTAILAVTGMLIVLIVVAGVFGSTATTKTLSPPAPTVPAASATVPAPQASPKGTVSGTCDVSLSDSLDGQDYLTADVTVVNTGNIGEVVKARASWPQQGFAAITASKTLRVPFGATKVAHLHYAASTAQISRFQDVQLSALSSGADPCAYRGDLVDTFGLTH